MKSYGRVEEYKASLFEAVTPFSVAVSTSKWVPILWPSVLDELDVCDSDIYTYDENDNGCVVIKKTGWYHVRASINIEQTSGSYQSNVYCALYAKPPGSKDFSRIAKTLSFAYMRNSSSRYGTINIDANIPITQENTVASLNVLRQNVFSSIYVRSGEATLSIRRLRPMRDFELEKYGVK